MNARTKPQQAAVLREALDCAEGNFRMLDSLAWAMRVAAKAALKDDSVQYATLSHLVALAGTAQWIAENGQDSIADEVDHAEAEA